MKKKLYRLYKNTARINLKSIIFNFKNFDLKTAIKLPILLHRKTKILMSKGRIELPTNLSFGMIRFGYGGSIFDLKEQKSVWQLDGKVIFKGNATFGNGSTLSVINNAEISIGKNFSCGSNCKILCRKRIELGDNSLLSWDITIMDTDFHAILNIHQRQINAPKPIIIRENVWIGCNSMILKGVEISSHSIIASNTVVSKTESEENIIIGSNKQEVIKKNISWRV